MSVAMFCRLLTFLLHIKEEERLGFLVVLVWEKLCLSWNLSTMLRKLMVCFFLIIMYVHTLVDVSLALYLMPHSLF